MTMGTRRLAHPRRPVGVGLLLLLTLVAGACSAPTPEAEAANARDNTDHRAHAMVMEALGAGQPTASSLYVLDQTWTDQQGRSVRLEDLAGRPRIIAMVYTHCTWACPRIVAEMKRIEAAVADLPADRAPGFVLVSIDPERDTPDRLATFARETRLDPTRWMLLSGPDDQVLELSVLLGVKYRATPKGEFSHSNLVTALDAEGAVAARVEGLDADIEPLIDTLRRLGGATQP